MWGGEMSAGQSVENLIDLNVEKNKVLNDRALKSYSKYLSLLGSSEIRVETKHLNTLILESKLDDTLIQKSHLLLAEISKRTKSTSPSMAKSLESMLTSIKKTVDNNLLN
jgi:hypothetical protein